MSVLSIVLLVLFGFSSVLLVMIILMQDEQGEGLGGIFGGSNASSQIGNRKGNILTKTSSILGTLFLVLAFGLAWINHTSNPSAIEDALKSQESTTQDWWKTDDSVSGVGTGTTPLSGTGEQAPAPAGDASGATEPESQASSGAGQDLPGAPAGGTQGN